MITVMRLIIVLWVIHVPFFVFLAIEQHDLTLFCFAWLDVLYNLAISLERQRF